MSLCTAIILRYVFDGDPLRRVKIPSGLEPPVSTSPYKNALILMHIIIHLLYKLAVSIIIKKMICDFILCSHVPLTLSKNQYLLNILATSHTQQQIIHILFLLGILLELYVPHSLATECGHVMESQPTEWAEVTVGYSKPGPSLASLDDATCSLLPCR